MRLVAATRGIDVILGWPFPYFYGETGFLPECGGESIPVLHTGRSGIFVGELDLTLTKE